MLITGLFLYDIVQCRYNTVNIFQNTRNRHPIAHPWSRVMGCLLWVQIMSIDPCYNLIRRPDCCTTSYMNRQISYISRTKSPILNVSRLVFQLFLPNPLKPGVKSRMKMSQWLEQRRQAMLQQMSAMLHQHLRDQQFYCLLQVWRYLRLIVK